MWVDSSSTQTYINAPYLLDHSLDFPLLAEHHVVQVFDPLTQFHTFRLQLFGPKQDQQPVKPTYRYRVLPSSRNVHSDQMHLTSQITNFRKKKLQAFNNANASTLLWLRMPKTWESLLQCLSCTSSKTKLIFLETLKLIFDHDSLKSRSFYQL